LVLVDEATYDVKTSKFNHSAQVITQLMGPKDDVTRISESAGQINKGPWKNVDQLRPL